MAPRIFNLPKLAAKGSPSAIFALVIVVMLWGVVGYKFMADRQSDMDDAERTARNYAMIFEENVLRSLGEIDKSLLYLRRTIEGRAPDADLGKLANTRDVMSEIIVQVAIIDKHGIMRATNIGPQPAPPTYLGDREHFQVHVDSSRDELFMSKPLIGRASNRWSVQFSRRLVDAAGRFDGVVVASLDPHHFTNFYDRIDLGGAASVAMIGADGIVRSSGGSEETFKLGQDLRDSDIGRLIVSGQHEKLIHQEGPSGPLVMALRQVRGFPLWVSVGLREADIYKDSWAGLALSAMLAAVSMILVLLGTERLLQSEEKRSQMEADLARLAAEDPLTRLPNRRVFKSALELQLVSGGPAGVQPEIGVMFLDLDRFKLVNDTLGHRVGDLLLQQVARRLSAEVGPNATLARLGGDEFAVMWPKTRGREELEAAAGRLLTAIEQPFFIDGHHLRSGVSIGIAVAPADGVDAEAILMSADVALYEVKAGTRGQYKFFDRAMTIAVAERRQLEIDLRTAVARELLHLEYQPIICATDGRVVGYEALARWHDPVRGRVPPAEFIPVAEDCGLIQQIGDWALREACREAAGWPGSMRVAVNLSPLQMASNDLVDTVTAALRLSSLAPERLELEITESTLLERTDATVSTLNDLRALGVRIALDDFGTGYSSLSYLRSFPFDKIKIDQAFVSGLERSPENAAIIKAVIDIAQALGMTTTAEGVESMSQARRLAELGCGTLQGYLFSPPVRPEKLPDLHHGRSLPSRLAA